MKAIVVFLCALAADAQLFTFTKEQIEVHLAETFRALSGRTTQDSRGAS
jgi:hypothetical protein